MRRRGIGLVLAVLVLLLAGCGGGNGQSAEEIIARSSTDAQIVVREAEAVRHSDFYASGLLEVQELARVADDAAGQLVDVGARLQGSLSESGHYGGAVRSMRRGVEDLGQAMAELASCRRAGTSCAAARNTYGRGAQEWNSGVSAIWSSGDTKAPTVPPSMVQFSNSSGS